MGFTDRNETGSSRCTDSVRQSLRQLLTLTVWQSPGGFPMKPPAVMVLTACLLLLALADYRSGAVLHELAPGMSRTTARTASGNVETVLAAPACSRPCGHRSPGWRACAAQARLPRAGQLRGHTPAARARGRARQAGRGRVPRPSRHRHPKETPARRDAGPRPPSKTWAPTGCAKPPSPLASDAFAAGWMLQAGGGHVETSACKADIATLAALDEPLGSASARDSDHGLGFDPLAEPSSSCRPPRSIWAPPSGPSSPVRTATTGGRRSARSAIAFAPAKQSPRCSTRPASCPARSAGGSTPPTGLRPRPCVRRPGTVDVGRRTLEHLARAGARDRPPQRAGRRAWRCRRHRQARAHSLRGDPPPSSPARSTAACTWQPRPRASPTV